MLQTQRPDAWDILYISGAAKTMPPVLIYALPDGPQ